MLTDGGDIIFRDEIEKKLKSKLDFSVFVNPDAEYRHDWQYATMDKILDYVGLERSHGIYCIVGKIIKKLNGGRKNVRQSNKVFIAVPVLR